MIFQVCCVSTKFKVFSAQIAECSALIYFCKMSPNGTNFCSSCCHCFFLIATSQLQAFPHAFYYVADVVVVDYAVSLMLQTKLVIAAWNASVPGMLVVMADDDEEMVITDGCKTKAALCGTNQAIPSDVVGEWEVVIDELVVTMGDDREMFADCQV